jgi:lysophospholipase L1-like esterase
MTTFIVTGRLRIFLSRFMLIVISLLAGLLLAEGLTRVFFPQMAPRTAQLTKFWKYDSRYGWLHIPGASGTFESYGIDSFVTINAKGFRGPEIEYTRDQKRQRILVLGDSYVWGYGVNQEEMFTERLRKAMPEVEVVNLGVSGYSTDQELLLYRDEGYKYKADLVMIVVADNDPPGNVLAEQYVVYGKPVFQLKDQDLLLSNHPVARASLWKRVLTELTRRSSILNTANKYLYAKTVGNTAPTAQRKSADGGSGAVPTSPKKFPRTPADEITVRLLLELRQVIPALQGAGKLLVVFVDGMTGISRDMMAYLTPYDIPCLDLGEHIDFKDKSLHLADDFHWNAEGHKRVADILAQNLDKLLK